jgi:sulfur dioxygenase
MWQVDRHAKLIGGLGLRLTLVLNTHCHADHITGTGRIKALCPGVRSRIAAASGAACCSPLAHGDKMHVGTVTLTALATPGHTDGCMSFHMAPVAEGQAGLVFTGDALLIRGCGRTDFQQGR